MKYILKKGKTKQNKFNPKMNQILERFESKGFKAGFVTLLNTV